MDAVKQWCYSSVICLLINQRSFMPAYITVHLIDEFAWVITLLLVVFELMLLMIVPHDLPVHYRYCAFYVIEKVHFITTLISLQRLLRLAPRMNVITRLQCSSISQSSKPWQYHRSNQQWLSEWFLEPTRTVLLWKLGKAFIDQYQCTPVSPEPKRTQKQICIYGVLAQFIDNT